MGDGATVKFLLCPAPFVELLLLLGLADKASDAGNDFTGKKPFKALLLNHIIVNSTFDFSQSPFLSLTMDAKQSHLIWLSDALCYRCQHCDIQ